VSNLQIVVLCDELHEPIERFGAFFLGEAVDVLHVVADCEDELPARDGIGTNHWMYGAEACANILECSTRLRVEFKAIICCGAIEARLGVGGGQTFEESLVGR
jgi:hypothetical protein